MNFLSQSFDFTRFYNMTSQVFNILGYDYYKGLKGKLPPIRYMGLDDGIEKVIFAHPKDYISEVELFKKIYNNLDLNNTEYLDDKKDCFLEIYPSLLDLNIKPNGFIGLFVNEIGRELIINEFNINDEVNNIHFLEVTEFGIDIVKSNLIGVATVFIKKFNSSCLKYKYVGLYLVVGEMNNINIKTNITKPSYKYNLFGGKRLYNETTLQGVMREIHEELGLNKNSKLYNLLLKWIPRAKDIIKCLSFNIYCIHYTPNNYNNYESL